MQTSDKGTLAELKVKADLNSKGFRTATPDGDNLPFDVIAITPDFKLLMIQVKYSKIREDGTVPLQLYSMTRKGRTRYTDDIDIFAVYVPNIDKCFYVPREAVKDKKSQFNLRIVESKNNQKVGVNMARDYEIFPERV